MKREENIGNIGKLIVTKELQAMIDYLHFKVGSLEWSGILFYKITKGSIDNLKDLEITASFVYPMDIGSHAYTEFDYDTSVANAYDVYEQGLSSSIGLVHSHNNFSTFFSGTDTQELKDNSGKYNYYVSLIVNFAHEYCAKIAIPAKTKVKSENWFKNTLGKLVPFINEIEQETLLIGDLTIEIEGATTIDWLQKRITELEEKKKKVTSNLIVFENGLFRNKVNNSFVKDTVTKSIAATKMSNRSDFLRSLIGLNTDTLQSPYMLLQEMKDMTEEELEVYEDSLDTNIEVIHENIYKDTTLFRKHCIDALAELHQYESTCGKIKAFDTVDLILSNYATI